MKIVFKKEPNLNVRVISGCGEDLSISSTLAATNSEEFSFITQALKSKSFTGKSGKYAEATVPNKKSPTLVGMVGYGDISKFTAAKIVALGGSIASYIKTISGDDVCIIMDNLKADSLTDAQIAANLAYGLLLKSWAFDKYKKPKDDAPKLPKTITFVTPSPDKAEVAFEELKAVADGVFLTRELVSEPCNIIYPETFVDRVQDLKKLGVKIEVLEEKDMAKLGMNALLGVGQGSVKDSKLLILTWDGGKKDQPPVAIVGKGVTFDTGGISLKPSANMDEMKMDMAGAGVVAGLLQALASRKAQVNVVGVAGLVENMPSGSAQRPGDVVKAMSGTTVEILNTDAEGRLVLADALWYTQNRFKPKVMINLATLTGAILVALGHEFAGLFSNNDDLSQKLIEAGQATDEPLWRMPLSEAFDKDIESDIADIRNIGTGGLAGSSTAAQFLQRFVNDVPWAHLDIAGTASTKKDKSLSGKGASGFGVRLLNDYIQKNFEGKS
ncbi:MAG: leucyl aminopeptidase [Alphaproteobacteria bacterium]|nr:leucyl aminopeptidase [Alphaproteobacteria bacterium]OJV46841.1 MAG: leucyl aminopeptidase [Alphaproteobacteria bacterium 43-37]